MELKIYSPQDNGFAQVIQWNFEELKQNIAEAAAGYEASVYTDDTIKSAKADRAKLNKFIAALETKRKEIKKQYLDPYQKFEEQEKELVRILERAINNIDSQVKGYEERMRAEKTQKVREFYEENINDMAEILPFERVFKPEYANASTTMKSIKEDIQALIQKVEEGIAIINEVDSKFAGDMKKVFLATYDIGSAMAKRNQLEEEERRREEYEQERRRRAEERRAAEAAEAQRVAQIGATQHEPVKEAVSEVPEAPVAPKPVEEALIQLDFRVYASKVQLDQLKNFLKDHNIKFGPVPKEGK